MGKRKPWDSVLVVVIGFLLGRGSSVSRQSTRLRARRQEHAFVDDFLGVITERHLAVLVHLERKLIEGALARKQVLAEQDTRTEKVGPFELRERRVVFQIARVPVGR